MNIENKLLITENDFIFTIPSYRGDWYFQPSGEVNIGQLLPYSTLYLPIEIIRIHRYNVPEGWIELQDTNNVIHFCNNME